MSKNVARTSKAPRLPVWAFLLRVPTPKCCLIGQAKLVRSANSKIGNKQNKALQSCIEGALYLINHCLQINSRRNCRRLVLKFEYIKDVL